MSAKRTSRPGEDVLTGLALLAEDLAEALANGDMEGAREAHGALGVGLVSAGGQPAAVVDLARERRRRAGTRRRRG